MKHKSQESHFRLSPCVIMGHGVGVHSSDEAENQVFSMLLDEKENHNKIEFTLVSRRNTVIFTLAY